MRLTAAVNDDMDTADRATRAEEAFVGTEEVTDSSSVSSTSITTAEDGCISVIGDALTGFKEDGNRPRLGEGIHDSTRGSPTGCHCRLRE